MVKIVPRPLFKWVFLERLYSLPIEERKTYGKETAPENQGQPPDTRTQRR